MTNPPPLDGLKVLDLTQFMAGPFCTMLLADMGADVIKIEKPDGDDIRRSGPPFTNGESAAFMGINRNKRSIVIDLKSGEGQSLVRRMARDADVLVENMRPGTMDRMGLGYEDLHNENPALVYCSISGFGTTGPYKDRPGFDLMAQGMSGLMSITGVAGGPPMRNGPPITDLNAGIYAAFGVMTAYVNRLKTGAGQYVDASLLEAGIGYTIWESAIFFATGVPPEPVGSGHHLSAPYQAFATTDGYIMVGGANQANWERLCGAIGREDLLEDDRFASNALRMQNLPPLEETLQETLSSQSTAHWLEALGGAGVPCGPINNIAQVFDEPQVQHRGGRVMLRHPANGDIPSVGNPL